MGSKPPRKEMRIQRAAVLLLVMFLALVWGGCAENSSNADGPEFGEVHEPGWRFLHPFEFQEDLFGCRVCHGINLEGLGGPGCLDCHVIDPIENPSGCVSCHGSPVTSPEAWASLVGRTEPLDPAFLESVRRSVDLVDPPISLIGHLMHEAIPLENRDELDDCLVCHGEGDLDPDDPGFITDPRRNVNRHHLIVGEVIPADTESPFGVPGQTYFCNTCHAFQLDPDTGLFDLVVPRDCSECHTTLLPQ